MYTILQCFAPLFQDAAGLGACPDVEGVASWMDGRPITAPVPEPLAMELDAEAPGVLLELYQLEMLIMTERLLAALREAGVDNLQDYALHLRDPATGQVTEGYRAVNVVGLVACADLGRSTFEAPPGAPMLDVDFDGLVIDEARAGGRLLFRLAECVSAIVVHDSVREHLLARGFDMLTFQPPSEFVG